MNIQSGTIFGRWTYLHDTRSNKNWIRYCLCRCVCGTEREVVKRDLLIGRSTSCGCAISPKAKIRATKHGEARIHLYRLWGRIKRRCLKTTCQDYANYGGRGITVYAGWIDNYEAFAEYVRTNLGERPSPLHSLDRIKNNEGYIPGNIRWSTAKTQANNTRNTKILTFKGEQLPLTEWAVKTGIPYMALYSRLYKHGWTLEAALTTPSLKQRSKS